jgi:hypothetical protein
MTVGTGLDWLKVGETVAYIRRARHSNERVSPATVDKIGKRDVQVTINGVTQKFNINHTENGHLYRRDIAYGVVEYLMPSDHPRAVKARAQQQCDFAARAIDDHAHQFARTPDVEHARTLRDAIDVFLKLHEKDKS